MAKTKLFDQFFKLLSQRESEQYLTETLKSANTVTLKRGAELGWVVPLQMPYPIYKEFVDNKNNTLEQVDLFFSQFYKRDFDNRLKDDLITFSKNIPESLQVLLNEVIHSYKNCHFQICVPALFAVIEGSLIHLTNQPRVQIKYNESLKEGIQNEALGFNVIFHISISEFLSMAFKSESFEKTDFNIINRHWSQHGRYITTLDETAILKLFGAVSLLLAAIHYQLDEKLLET